jgi:hypothetical protein
MSRDCLGGILARGVIEIRRAAETPGSKYRRRRPVSV